MADHSLGPAKAGRKPIATPGDRYGRLVILEFVRDDWTKGGGQRRPVYRFRCDCGTDVDTRIYSVRSGKTQSCGCQSRISRPRHGACVGKRLTPEWRAWRDMLTRATNPNIAHARHYVGRGIGVCAEWNYGGDGNGFVCFLAHIGPKPSPRMTVDRIDNDRGYEPGNVRWATYREQGVNKSNNRLIPVSGVIVPLTVAADMVGIKASIIVQRIDRLGWTVERALTAPPKPDRRRAA